MPSPKPAVQHPIYVSEADVMPVRPRNGLVAFASCVINGQIYLGNIAIHTKPDGSGYRLVFPVKALPNGKQVHCCHPIAREAADLIHQAIIGRLEALAQNYECGEKVETMTKQSGGSNEDDAGVP